MIEKPSFVVEKKGQLVVSPAELARYVEENLHYLVVEESLEFRRMYVYKNGVYCLESREGFTGIMHGFVKDYIVQISTIREAVSILYITHFTFKGML
ncbi:MAG: hypothetical protein IJQ24_04585 [Synergistaceae bacterium]|nr:hypothetical protein [Synergistaceae bacterium]